MHQNERYIRMTGSSLSAGPLVSIRKFAPDACLQPTTRARQNIEWLAEVTLVTIRPVKLLLP
jgi:hypothetical protein